MERLRIHGDNIVECTRALRLVAECLDATTSTMDSPPYAPVFRLKSSDGLIFDVQLVPGYGRWGFSFPDYLRARGARLREATDAIITRVEELNGDSVAEEPIVSFEFCGALPAGNNAWQRTGRALALAEADLPYLYYAELGGLELDSGRKAKAPRWPNPLVPFAYVETGDVLDTLTVPVYTKSPTASKEVIKPYEAVLDEGESHALLAALITNKDFEKAKQALRHKAMDAVKALAAQRKRKDTLRGKDWDEFESLDAGGAKVEWLLKKGMSWNKKLGLKTLTPSFLDLLGSVKKMGCVAPGAQDIPFCVLSASKRKDLATQIERIYSGKASQDFLEWLQSSESHLIIVWVAGFKPRGDDSRPDRGLVPLARMIFGFKDVDLISVVYGPAKPEAWKKLSINPSGLAEENGLWEAIIRLSDGVIIDSSTSQSLKRNTFLFPTVETNVNPIKLNSNATLVPQFGEQDIDTVLHMVFSSLADRYCFEGMCNPPGGDWSGMSFYQFSNGVEYRWTSLPRVSGEDSKRPDHVIQIDNDEKLIIAIESKDTAEKLESKIGPRLIKYVTDLTKAKPSVERGQKEAWKPFAGKPFTIPHNIVSCGSFRYHDGLNLMTIIERGEVDIAIAVQFHSSTESATLHIKGTRPTRAVIALLTQSKGSLPSRIKIQVY